MTDDIPHQGHWKCVKTKRRNKKDKNNLQKRRKPSKTWADPLHPLDTAFEEYPSKQNQYITNGGTLKRSKKTKGRRNFEKKKSEKNMKHTLSNRQVQRRNRFNKFEISKWSCAKKETVRLVQKYKHRHKHIEYADRFQRFVDYNICLLCNKEMTFWNTRKKGKGKGNGNHFCQATSEDFRKKHLFGLCINHFELAEKNLELSFIQTKYEKVQKRLGEMKIKNSEMLTKCKVEKDKILAEYNIENNKMLAKYKIGVHFIDNHLPIKFIYGKNKILEIDASILTKRLKNIYETTQPEHKPCYFAKIMEEWQHYPEKSVVLIDGIPTQQFETLITYLTSNIKDMLGETISFIDNFFEENGLDILIQFHDTANYFGFHVLTEHIEEKIRSELIKITDKLTYKKI